MRIANGWEDYELLDCSDGERLERWGEILLIRPDPQVIWKTEKRKNPLWRKAHACYYRSPTGGGRWELQRKLPEDWVIRYGELRFGVKLMGFKHTGLFPEQAVNWEHMASLIRRQRRSAGNPVRVLNLFAYTGGATLSCLAAGASVVHVDAARGMVLRARENASLSALREAPVRWIVEDCIKFVQREIRRGNLYDIIIMDPPSYGRGPNAEVWKLEQELCGLIELSAKLLHPDALLLLLNSYTTEFSPAVMRYLLSSVLVPQLGGEASADEIGLPVSATGLVLPCGSTAMWER
ncbi:MAG: class I SAM-dependent methyltransferase [Oscillospiraceae bacterium]|jgi:23S rRNA (cytosine1962-C5)-methyltransferase|nr:class I SAM-dependent methyltransferase [Oscillospiraceae bacterium]